MSLSRDFLERFASTATVEGLVDAVFAQVSTPFGKLLLVQSGAGVCKLGFPEEDPDEVLAKVADVIGPRILGSSSETAAAAEALEAYLEGETPKLEVPVDLALVRSDFQRDVLVELQRIGRGEITTYGALAAKIGRPKAVRATGTALGRNPIPIIVPCHRVLPGSGGVGNYGGGPDRKRWLLSLEGAPLTAR